MLPSSVFKRLGGYLIRQACAPAVWAPAPVTAASPAAACLPMLRHFAAQPAVSPVDDFSSLAIPTIAQQQVQGNYQSYIIPVYNLNRELVGQHTLPGSIFDVPIRKDILHRVVRWQLAKRQQVGETHHAGHTQDEDAVGGAGRGPEAAPPEGVWPVPTGHHPRAAVAGGGTAHGPVVRSHEHKLLKRVRRLGLKCALSAKLWEGRLLVVDTLRPEEPKTKVMDAHVSALLAGAPRRSAVFVDSDVDGQDGGEDLRRGVRNIPWVEVLPARGLNVYSILQRDQLVMSVEGVERVVQRLQTPLKPWSPKP